MKPIPDAAEAALLPEEIKTTEQLYLTGLHLEQYRHATYAATDYYEEALSVIRMMSATITQWIVADPQGAVCKSRTLFASCCQDTDRKESEPV